jgi:large subunit ribosomal protein L3
MVNGLIGKKLGMTQIYTAEGAYIPVTVVESGPCRVVQKKTTGTDGYDAVQVAFQEGKEKHLTKPRLGHLKKASLPPYRHLREFRGDDLDALTVGQTLTVEIFQKGDLVDVSGTTIGKGFQGVIKRHKFSGGPASHGSMFHRAPGSIGSSAYPSRVIKNKKLPGQMGNKRRTTQNLEIVGIRPEENILLIRGSVPGSSGGIVIIRKAIKQGK